MNSFGCRGGVCIEESASCRGSSSRVSCRLPACCAAATTSSGAGAVAAAGREAPGATLPSHIFRRAVPVVFPGCCVFTTHSLRCGCAGRSCRSHSTSQHHELMGARRTTRTRRVHPASSWRQSRTCMSLSCTPQHPSNLAHSDGTDGLTRDSSSERPLPADLCGLAACKQHARCGLHARCMCAAGGSWIAPRKPLPAARLCGTMLIVRPRMQPRMPSPAAHQHALSTACVVLGWGGRVHSWATAAEDLAAP